MKCYFSIFQNSWSSCLSIENSFIAVISAIEIHVVGWWDSTEQLLPAAHEGNTLYTYYTIIYKCTFVYINLPESNSCSNFLRMLLQMICKTPSHTTLFPLFMTVSLQPLLKNLHEAFFFPLFWTTANFISSMLWITLEDKWPTTAGKYREIIGSGDCRVFDFDRIIWIIYMYNI